MDFLLNSFFGQKSDLASREPASTPHAANCSSRAGEARITASVDSRGRAPVPSPIPVPSNRPRRNTSPTRFPSLGESLRMTLIPLRQPDEAEIPEVYEHSQMRRNTSSLDFQSMNRSFRRAQARQRPHPDTPEARELRELKDTRLKVLERLDDLCLNVRTHVDLHCTWEEFEPRFEELVEQLMIRNGADANAAVEQAKQTYEIFTAKLLKSLEEVVREIVEEMQGPEFEAWCTVSLEEQLNPHSIFQTAIPLFRQLKDLHYDKYQQKRRSVMRRHRQLRQDSVAAD